MTSFFPAIPRLIIFLTTVVAAVAQTDKTNKPVPTAASKAEYPFKTCVVSDERLGEMGKPVEYVYKEAGQPDRTVFFCCRGCIKDFEKNPAAYLKKLGETAAKSADKK